MTGFASHLILSGLFSAWLPLLGSDPRLVIVVNPDSGVAQLTRDEARNIFLGRQKRLSSGLLAVPVEQASPAEARSHFYRLLVHKDLTEINAYWARLVFTGQTRPPRQGGSAEEVIRIVAATKGAIGLLESAKVDHRVKVVLALDDLGGGV